MSLCRSLQLTRWRMSSFMYISSTFKTVFIDFYFAEKIPIINDFYYISEQAERQTTVEVVVVRFHWMIIVCMCCCLGH